MASIDSSAPETTSSDNSPTLIRRSGWGKPAGPGSDSGSSGKSSDSFGSSSSGDKAGRGKGRENERYVANKFIVISRLRMYVKIVITIFVALLRILILPVVQIFLAMKQ